MTDPSTTLPSDVADALAEGRCARPFDALGLHLDPRGGRVVRAFVPGARAVSVIPRQGGDSLEMRAAETDGLFELHLPERERAFPYRLEIVGEDGARERVEDPYRFEPTVDEERVRAFLAGDELRVHEVLGARILEHQGIRGTAFAVWAPHARSVSLIGDMNRWDGRRHPMRPRGATGVWELFVPGVGPGARYKYRVTTAGGRRVDRADPCGRAMELRPATASEVWDPGDYEWSDEAWMESRRSRDPDAEPMAIYEVHLGSWRRRPPEEGDGDLPGWLGYRELAEELLPYVRDLGFTHVELLPILEHPLDESWGYQPLGFFAPTSRYGTPDDFRHFVDRAHQLGLGVLLDWVPGHFPRDAHGLMRFDGTTLYEHPDPRQAEHPDWGTLTFDFGKPAVQSFLISSALHWLEGYHLDGLRVDAVASMLYLDYSRPDGAWVPNRQGGRENLDAVNFLVTLNDAVHREVPGALMVAEESTAWPRVSHGTDRGGLGFDQKWNMGWMNDTLDVMRAEPVHRSGRYDRLTFSLMYAFSERFVLPLSHDEVVHGKGSLLSKMPGEYEERFANLRLLLAYLWSHPGKKLLFMGGELAQHAEWSEDGELDWALEAYESHLGVRRLVAELNRLYRAEEALHALDFHPDGFEWIDCHDPERTTLSFLRWAPGWSDFVVAAANFTPVTRDPFRLAVPFGGRYRTILNTAAEPYAAEATPVPDLLDARPETLHDRKHVVELPLPGLSVVWLKRVGGRPDQDPSDAPSAPDAESRPAVGGSSPPSSPRSAGA